MGGGWRYVSGRLPIRRADYLSRVFRSESGRSRLALQPAVGRLREELRITERADVMGARRVLVPCVQGLFAGSRAVHDSLPFVLCMAPRGRVRLVVRCSRSR